MPRDTSRRNFIETSAKLGAGLLAVPALGKNVLGANDRIGVGGIGIGQRGRGRIRSARDHNAQIVAVCDVNEVMFPLLEERIGLKPERYRNHEDLLDRKDIDAVVIASPDHWHHDHLVDAIRAGKDVYLEKPMSRTLEEGDSIVQTVEASDRIVQIGNHRRSGTHWEKARQMVAAGKIGALRFVRTWDTRYRPDDPYVARAKTFKKKEIDWMRFLGKAPTRPYDPVRLSAWRWFWDYAGGLMTDIGPHRLDVAHWISDTLGPHSVVCNGGNYHSPLWETPDNVHAILDCGTFCINFNVHFMNGQDSGGAGYYGTEGTILQKDGRMRLIDPKDRVIEEWETPGEGELHMENFLDCVRTRKAPNSPVGVAQKVLVGAHLANLSYKTGQRVHWDVESERIL